LKEETRKLSRNGKNSRISVPPALVKFLDLMNDEVVVVSGKEDGILGKQIIIRKYDGQPLNKKEDVFR